MSLPALTGGDIKALRARLGLSQREFAERYHMPLAALRNWEQERRGLDGAALVAFHLIAFNPEQAALALDWLAARQP
jgi:putative transcriptional regulator